MSSTRFSALAAKYGWTDDGVKAAKEDCLHANAPSVLVAPRSPTPSPELEFQSESEDSVTLDAVTRRLSLVHLESSPSASPVDNTFTRRRVVLSDSDSATGSLTPSPAAPRRRRVVVLSDSDTDASPGVQAPVSPASLSSPPTNDADCLSDNFIVSDSDLGSPTGSCASLTSSVGTTTPVHDENAGQPTSVRRRRVILSDSDSDDAPATPTTPPTRRLVPSTPGSVWYASTPLPPETPFVRDDPPLRPPSTPRLPPRTPARRPLAGTENLPPKPAPKTPTTSKKLSKKRRDTVLTASYAEFNANVFDGALPADLQITWGPRLTKTAGLTYSKRSRDGTYSARIELSTKVLDTESKLRSTLLHEMCHVAAWLIDHVCKPPHGSHFWAWAKHATAKYPDHAVSRCHSYSIDYKFVYRCTNVDCGVEVGRHSKSIDVGKQVCGRCRSALTLLTKTADGTPAKPRAATGFSLYVKKHYARVKSGGGLDHGRVMKELSSMWKTASEDDKRASAAVLPPAPTPAPTPPMPRAPPLTPVTTPRPPLFPSRTFTPSLPAVQSDTVDLTHDSPSPVRRLDLDGGTPPSVSPAPSPVPAIPTPESEVPPPPSPPVPTIPQVDSQRWPSPSAPPASPSMLSTLQATAPPWPASPQPTTSPAPPTPTSDDDSSANGEDFHPEGACTVC